MLSVPAVARAVRLSANFSAFLLFTFSIPLLPGQNEMQPATPGGTVQLISNDAAVLETEEIKKDLPCTVTSIKPILGFDLRFHSGYDVAVPLRELAGDSNQLTIIFRVTLDGNLDHPVYFSQHYTVPQLNEDIKGDAYLEGGFDVGEGGYHVSWMMRDRQERVCSSNWDAEASLNGKDQNMKLAITAGSIEASDDEFFRAEPPVVRENVADPLRVKVLINFAPQRSFAATIPPIDMSALVSILRNISREPRIYKFSLVAFNMNEQRVFYRQDDSAQIDFPELGKALASVKPGMIDYQKLIDPHSGGDFLTQLVAQELANNTVDAVIFAGPKVMIDDSIPSDNLKSLVSVPYPVFYMNYNLVPQQNPWRDPIGNVVKKLRGYEYTISRPRDVWTSWSDIMGHIVKLKLVSSSGTSSH